MKKTTVFSARVDCYVVPVKSEFMTEKVQQVFEGKMKCPVSSITFLPDIYNAFCSSDWGIQGNRSLDSFLEFLRENEVKFIIP